MLPRGSTNFPFLCQFESCADDSTKNARKNTDSVTRVEFAILDPSSFPALTRDLCAACRMAAETSVSWEVGATDGGKGKGLDGKVADRELARRRLITTVAQLGDIQKGLQTSILVAVASVYVETRRMPQKVAPAPRTRCNALSPSILNPLSSTLNP
jgi:hypothetical protein